MYKDNIQFITYVTSLQTRETIRCNKGFRKKSKSKVKRRRVKAIETKDIHSLLEPIKVDMNNVLEDQ